jgi:hypothetical protein
VGKLPWLRLEDIVTGLTALSMAVGVVMQKGRRGAEIGAGFLP